ncbi:MAG: acyl-CoA reductase [Lachnospiraceae bacterium]|nr:acyl-CoA reductase [Lachnospiraceae bacterium]
MAYSEVLKKVDHIVGTPDSFAALLSCKALKPFDDRVCSFLSDLSEMIMKDPQMRAFPDVMTFGFWIRRSSVAGMKERFERDFGDTICRGKGLVFHIAPSNVPMNFAYSLAAGLLMGNSNIVRIPSKDFPQTGLTCSAIRRALEKNEDIRPYIYLVKYGHDREVNDLFSSVCDERIIWGGDRTIEEIRLSPLLPRSQEITFADRYSLAVIDSDAYMGTSDKERLAGDFYNDTYLTDQNACTSPRIVIWIGDRVEEARSLFWKNLHDIVKEKYRFEAIQAVDKLDAVLNAGCDIDGLKLEENEDNLIVRVRVSDIYEDIMDHICHSGYFYEYICEDILKIIPLCDDKRCQTISYIGPKEMITPLTESGVKGIDRVIPIGRTMDFELIWDGYDLRSQLTRIIKVE